MVEDQCKLLISKYDYGQFSGQIKLEWNSNYSDNNTLYLSNIDAASINSVNMTKFMFWPQKVPSASELVINGLKPYMNVVQIGDVTYGKNVASLITSMIRLLLVQPKKSKSDMPCSLL
jgi:hypothetical protein